MHSGSLSLDDARARLARTGWLSACPAPFAQAVLAAGLVRHLQPGEPFNIAGDIEGGIWGIAEGQASGISGINGPAAPVSFVMHPGYWGGTGPLFGFPRIGHALARTPATILLVPYRALKRLLAETPAWWEHLGALNFRIIRHYGSFAVDLQLPDSRQRTAAILLQVAGLRFEGEPPRTVDITQAELGQIANLSRHPVGEHLRAFVRQGLITLGYRQVTLHDVAALRALADGS
jgi:CRP/FNR family transcriptional regulator, cyclic AMP receptor protein